MNTTITIYQTDEMADGTIEVDEIDIIVISPKHSNIMECYGIEYDDNKASQIYDMADGKILLRPNP